MRYLSLLLVLIVSVAQADCVVYFYNVEDKVQEKAIWACSDTWENKIHWCTSPDIAKEYGVTKFPTFVFVSQLPTGNYDIGRVEGNLNQYQLHELQRFQLGNRINQYIYKVLNVKFN